MPTSTTPQQTIAELLVALEAAVHAEDRALSMELEQKILQCLSSEAADRYRIEPQARTLLEKLDRSQPESRLIERGQTESFDLSPAEMNRKVWFGTNREPSSTHGVGFEGHRYNETTLGFAHAKGDNKVEVSLLNNKDFYDQIKKYHDDKKNEMVKKNRIETLHSLIYLHGFKTKFADAVENAAKLSENLKLNGAIAMFSWPSRGGIGSIFTLEDYFVDEATIEGGEAAITEFLGQYAENCGADQVHVIAHSMGTRGLLRALQRIAANPEKRDKVKFGQIIFAAPDVDRDLFLDITRLCFDERPKEGEAPKEPKLIRAKRATLYGSYQDGAVFYSELILHSGHRAGFFRPIYHTYTVNQEIFDTVAVDTGILVDFPTGHGYYISSTLVRHDENDLIRYNASPDNRVNLKEITAKHHQTNENHRMWELDATKLA